MSDFETFWASIEMIQEPNECRDAALMAWKEQQDRIDKLEKAMQEFVDRCDAGHVRSKYTYNLFKELLITQK